MAAQAPPENAVLPAAGGGLHAHSSYRYAVGLGLLAWLLTDLSTRAFSNALPATMGQLGLPLDAISLPGAVAGLTTTFAAIPMGWLADRVDGKPLLLTGLLMAAGASALALIGSEAMFGVVALLISTAGVLLPPVVIRLLRWLAHDMRGACLGVLLVMSTGGSGMYYVAAIQLGEATGWDWRTIYIMTLAATLLLAVLILATFRVPNAEEDVPPAPTLPLRTLLHLSAATTVLAAIAGGTTQLAGKLYMDLRDAGETLEYFSQAFVLPLPLTIIGAIVAAFLHGPQARWLPWLTLGAAALCLAALGVGAAAGGAALSWYSLSVVLACGAFAFGVILSTCACWAAENMRGLLTGALFATKQLLGAIFGAVLVAVSGESIGSAPAWGLGVTGLVLCAWSMWHAYRAARTLQEVETVATSATSAPT